MVTLLIQNISSLFKIQSPNFEMFFLPFIENKLFSPPISWLQFPFPLLFPVPTHFPFHPDVTPFCLSLEENKAQETDKDAETHLITHSEIP